MAGISLERIKQRRDFLHVAEGAGWQTPGFILQGRRRTACNREGLIRIGFTCSRKVGNAVVRNRARRRLAHAADIVLPHHGIPGWDYVMIGLRFRTVSRNFAKLTQDLETAVRRLAHKEMR
ncbi:MAG: ribonuclease P protein component [Rhodobacteraceae bacterium]|nr:ribonuclease P protein component [Paracoccaceae bacterium]